MYGKEFHENLLQLTNYTTTAIGSSMQAIKIADVLWIRAKNKWNNLQPCLYIIFDVNGVKKEHWVNPTEGRKRFLKFLKYVRTISNYEGDYQLDDDVHLIALKIPKRFHNAYYKFLQSRYSEMYTEKDIKDLKITPKNEYSVFNIVTNNPKYKEAILKFELQKIYDTTVIPDGISENSLPWLIRDEIHHYEFLTEQEKEILKQYRNDIQGSKVQA
jgi:hypothetical protein